MYQLPLETINLVLHYLFKQPYNEVVQLIAKMQEAEPAIELIPPSGQKEGA